MKGWKFYYKNLGHALENSFRKYRAYLKPKSYARYRSVVVKKYFESPLVSVIDLGKTEILTDSGRYFYALVSGLLDAGHDVYLVRKLWLVSELYKKKFSAKLLDSKKIHFIDKKQVMENDASIVFLFFDSENCQNGSSSLKKISKRIILLRSSFRPKENKLWMPYQVHPEIQEVPEHDQLSLAKIRRLGVFFIGNVVPVYDSDFVKSHHVMTRIQVLETLIDSAPNIIRYEMIDGLEELNEQAKSSVFLPSYDQKSRKSNGKIPAEKYMGILSEIDFVICTPGTYMPFAHNVIEAMSQGCIPIIEYGHYFCPELEDGINCLVFKDEESLKLAVNRAVEMSSDGRERIRKEVWRYYNEHLKFSTFLNELEKLESPVKAFYYA